MQNANDLQTTVLVVPKWAKPFDQSPLTKDNIIVVSALATQFKVLLPIPEDADYDFPEIKNVTYIPFPFSFPDFKEEVFFTDKWFELFNTRRGKYCWDVIFNFKTMITDLFKKLACPHPGDFWDKIPFPAFSAPYCWVRTSQRFKEMKMEPGVDVQLEILNVLQADGVFVRIEQEKKYIQDELRQVIKPAVFKDLSDKIHPVTCYVPPKFVEDMKPNKVKRNVLTAGRWSGAKGMDQCFKLFTDASKVFRDVDFIINTQSKKDLEGMDCTQVQVHIGQGYEEHKRRLVDCSVFVTFSTVESFGHTNSEAIMAGKPVLMKRAKWQKNFIPESYPYFFNTNEQALFMLKKILSNYELACEETMKLKDYFLTEFSIEKAGQKFAEKINKVIDEQTGKFCKKLGEMSSVKGFLYSSKDIVSASKEFNIPLSVARQLIRHLVGGKDGQS